jgi:cytochrome c-type biogenesis protein
MPFSPANTRMGKRHGLSAAFILGLVFGLALGPCAFAFMVPVLGIALSMARTDLVYGILLLGAYGIGHCGVIVAAGTSTVAVERYLKWSGASRGLGVLKKVCGVLVILGGVYLLWVS